jgi:hypothetical protein
VIDVGGRAHDTGTLTLGPMRRAITRFDCDRSVSVEKVSGAKRIRVENLSSEGSPSRVGVPALVCTQSRVIAMGFKAGRVQGTTVGDAHTLGATLGVVEDGFYLRPGEEVLSTTTPAQHERFNLESIGKAAEVPDAQASESGRDFDAVKVLQFHSRCCSKKRPRLACAQDGVFLVRENGGSVQSQFEFLITN